MLCSDFFLFFNQQEDLLCTWRSKPNTASIHLVYFYYLGKCFHCIWFLNYVEPLSPPRLLQMACLLFTDGTERSIFWLCHFSCSFFQCSKKTLRSSGQIFWETREHYLFHWQEHPVSHYIQLFCVTVTWQPEPWGFMFCIHMDKSVSHGSSHWMLLCVTSIKDMGRAPYWLNVKQKTNCEVCSPALAGSPSHRCSHTGLKVVHKTGHDSNLADWKEMLTHYFFSASL